MEAGKRVVRLEEPKRKRRLPPLSRRRLREEDAGRRSDSRALYFSDLVEKKCRWTAATGVDCRRFRACQIILLMRPVTLLVPLLWAEASQRVRARHLFAVRLRSLVHSNAYGSHPRRRGRPRLCLHAHSGVACTV
jgi:hypothetical protein